MNKRSENTEATPVAPNVEGWEAARAGAASCECPYSEGTPEHEEWRSGHSVYMRLIGHPNR